MIILRFPSREAMQAYVLAESLKAMRGESTTALIVEPIRQEAEKFDSSESRECSILEVSQLIRS
jgi:hypothetical protein